MSEELTWTQKAEQEFIKLGYKKGNKTGSGVIISPSLCEKFKKAKEKNLFTDEEAKLMDIL